MVVAAEHRVPKLPLKLVFEFAQNLLNESLCWMIAPSAQFQESNKIPLPSTELRAKIKKHDPNLRHLRKLDPNLRHLRKLPQKLKLW